MDGATIRHWVTLFLDMVKLAQKPLADFKPSISVLAVNGALVDKDLDTPRWDEYEDGIVAALEGIRVFDDAKRAAGFWCGLLSAERSLESARHISEAEGNIDDRFVPGSGGRV